MVKSPRIAAIIPCIAVPTFKLKGGSMELGIIIGVASGLILLAALFFGYSLSTRKTYKCPECGETTKVEHMLTARCGMCGAELKRVE